MHKFILAGYQQLHFAVELSAILRVEEIVAVSWVENKIQHNETKFQLHPVFQQLFQADTADYVLLLRSGFFLPANKVDIDEQIESDQFVLLNTFCKHIAYLKYFQKALYKKKTNFLIF